MDASRLITLVPLPEAYGQVVAICEHQGQLIVATSLGGVFRLGADDVLRPIAFEQPVTVVATA